jgi:sugar phosphate isomerase/epimerase
MATVIGSTSRPYNKLSYTEAYARIGAAGYTDVAVFANDGQIPLRSDSTAEEVAAVRTAAADAGVKPSMILGRTQLGLAMDAAVDDYKRLIDNAAALETEWILELGTGNEDHFDAYFELMRQAAPYAQTAGLQITMKPHGGISLTTENLLAAYDRVGHPAFAICCDPGNIIYYTKGERRPEEDITTVAPKVSSVIIKDCVIKDGTPDVMVTPGDGLVDFPLILGALDNAGFTGPCYVECVGGVEPDQVDRDLAFTLGYVKGILASL